MSKMAKPRSSTFDEIALGLGAQMGAESGSPQVVDRHAKRDGLLSRIAAEVRHQVVEALGAELPTEKQTLLNDLLLDLSATADEDLIMLNDNEAMSQTKGTTYADLIAQHAAEKERGFSPSRAHSPESFGLQSWLLDFATSDPSPAFQPIFALLCHKSLAARDITIFQPEHLEVFLRGADALFWRDVQSGQQSFSNVFESLLAVVSDSAAIPSRYALALQLTAFRFYFQYQPPEGIGAFLNSAVFPVAVPSSDSRLVVHGVDDPLLLDSTEEAEVRQVTESTSASAPSKAIGLFVIEVCRVLRDITDDTSLQRYLDGITLGLAQLPLDVHSRVRLQTSLSPFTNPGGPLYPSRAVRRRALGAMNALTPGGAFARQLVKLAFRLLHPFRWPWSLLNWLLECRLRHKLKPG